MKSVQKRLKGALVITLAFVVVLFTACSGPTEKKEQNKKENTAQDVKEEKKKSTRNFEYPIPTPFEITAMLNKAGASYIIDLSNELSNSEKYMTEISKALNLGVYGADLSYASTYNKTENTRLYLAATQKLTEELGISSAINQTIIERVEKNINNNDSLHAIISSSYYDTFDFLNQHGKGAISVLVLAGGWIEGLYISTQLAQSAQNQEEIIKGIGEQKSTFDELIVLMRAYKDKNKGVADIYNELTKFKEVYDNVKDDEMMYDEQIEQLTAKVEALRKKVVSY